VRWVNFDYNNFGPTSVRKRHIAQSLEQLDRFVTLERKYERAVILLALLRQLLQILVG
jgi:hypothetical protein